jgi:hypothetical protein
MFNVSSALTVILLVVFYFHKGMNLNKVLLLDCSPRKLHEFCSTKKVNSKQTKLLVAQNNVYSQNPQQENYNSPSWDMKPVYPPVTTSNNNPISITRNFFLNNRSQHTLNACLSLSWLLTSTNNIIRITKNIIPVSTMYESKKWNVTSFKICTEVCVCVPHSPKSKVVVKLQVRLKVRLAIYYWNTFYITENELAMIKDW